MPSYPQGTFEYTGGIDGQSVSILGGWRVTLTHGLTPSVFYVSVPMPRAGANPPNKNGDVILRYGDTKITLKNCTIDKITQDVGGRLIWNAVIVDRRYRWRWSAISGAYNVRWRNGTDVREETKKRPSELAELCLERMLETNWNIEALKDFDDTDWPEINWNVANAGEALHSLCERYGMRPVFDWDEDRIVVVKVGEGEKLRLDLPFVEYSGAFDPPEKPGKIVLLCGPSSIQYDFATESVALDLDGKIKYPDQVVYRPKPPAAPSGGTAPDFSSGTILDEKWLPWAGMTTGFFGISVPYLRDLAVQCILKWYRIVPPKNMDGLEIIAGDREEKQGIGDFGSIAEDTDRSWLWQIALQGDQNDRLQTLGDPLNTEFDEYNNEVSQRQLQAWIYGQYRFAGFGNVLQDDLDADGVPIPLSGLKKLDAKQVFSPAQQDASQLPNQDTPSQIQFKIRATGFYDGSFSIDADTGVIKFAEQVYQYLAPKDAQITFRWTDGTSLGKDKSQAIFPATLFLRTRFFVRDKDTREFIRYQRTRVLDDKSDTVRYEVRDDLVFKLTYRPKGTIASAGFPPEWDSFDTENNKDAIDKAADQYLDQIEREYQTRTPETIVHPGFIDYTLDGAIRQITWNVDEAGKAWTRVSRDQEELHIVRDFNERRLAERLKAMAEENENRKPLPTPDINGNSLMDSSGLV